MLYMCWACVLVFLMFTQMPGSSQCIDTYVIRKYICAVLIVCAWNGLVFLEGLTQISHDTIGNVCLW